MRPEQRRQPNPSCSERRSTRGRTVHPRASNCHPWCAAPNLRLSVRVAVRSRHRCAPGAAKASMKRGPACSQQTAFALCWRACPLTRKARPCLSQLLAFVPPIKRGNATAAPSWHSAGRLQDKSRTSRTEGKSVNISTWRDVHFGVEMCNLRKRQGKQRPLHIASGHRKKARLGAFMGHSLVWRCQS
jgi:hypothetical protein